jgi:hypothetical protein
MPLAHAHKVFITFNLTIRISGVAVHVLRYEKEIFTLEQGSGKNGNKFRPTNACKSTFLFIRASA